jgi:putative ABC transport system substrate-binding protein
MNVARLVVVRVLAGGLATAPGLAEAQPAGKRPRIGVLVVATPGFPPIEGFRQGLRGLGYVEGRNIAIEYRYAEGKADRYAALAAEVIGHAPDVIVVWGAELPVEQPTKFERVIDWSSDRGDRPG